MTLHALPGRIEQVMVETRQRGFVSNILFLRQDHTDGFVLHLARPLVTGSPGTGSAILGVALADPARTGQRLGQSGILGAALFQRKVGQWSDSWLVGHLLKFENSFFHWSGFHQLILFSTASSLSIRSKLLFR